MIKVILGEKGTGKTKMLLDGVHEAVEKEKGSIVFINNGTRHILDMSHRIRLVDTSEFSIGNYDELYGLLCGIVAQNYDVSHIFMDSLTKIAEGEMDKVDEFLEKTEKLAEKFNLEFVITISMNPDAVSAKVRSYVA